jgi:2-polyprenyl-6-methoxyphenol hydroxylase-like FAD-dependent oxidoreductase
MGKEITMKGTPMNKKRALIVGSGIGGPVAAMALQRAGIEAVVYEAYDAPADYSGLFLNIASNGLDVLRTLDVDVPARADGIPAPPDTLEEPLQEGGRGQNPETTRR